MVKILYTNPYEHKMCSNKVECSTASRPHYTTYEVKVLFCMTEFSSSKIISQRFHVDNNEDESGISYGMIIGCDLMEQIGLSADFNRQFLQWDGVTVTIKEPSGLLCQRYLMSSKMS